MARDIITYANPFRAIDEFEKHLFGTPFASYETKGVGLFRTDIKEDAEGNKYTLQADLPGFKKDDIEDADGNKYTLQADLPGFKKDDIKLDVDGDLLTISAERKNEATDGDEAAGYIRRERSYGSYSRQFDISAIDPEKISASYEDGVLTLEMPKKEELVPKKHQISIQ